MLLSIGRKAEVAHGSGELPIQVPLGIVFSAMKIEKIFKYLGSADQFGVEFLGKSGQGLAAR